MQNQNKYIIQNEEYFLVKDYKDDDRYRHSLNKLTAKILGFDFEEWYQQGYWSDRYRPYSFLHKDSIVANVSVNPIDFCIDGQVKHVIQIGTVMTEEAYRNKGLIRLLMDRIFEEYEATSEFIYLYANDSVLEFYPKFGFSEAEEYTYSKLMNKSNNKTTVRKLDVQNIQDKALINRLVSNTLPISKYSMINNPGLVMFYLISPSSDMIYYIEDKDLLAVVEYKEDELVLLDVFCEKEFDLDEVLCALMRKEECKITLAFTPRDSGSYQCELWKEEGLTLFIKGKNPIIKGKLPTLSHA